MITEWFLNLALSFFTDMAAGLPRFSDAEGVVVTANTYVLSLGAGMASLSAWVPWGTIAVVLPLSVGIYVLSLGLRLLRVLLGHLPMIGGNG